MKAIVASVMSIVLASTTLTAQAVDFDWVTVGNRGNAPDDIGFGAVPYNYRISKYEVTNTQYTEFLNAVDPAGSNLMALYSPFMSSAGVGGITFDNNFAAGMKYAVKQGRDNFPVVFTSFFDSMRFVNWLENGQGNGDTESGVYTIGNGINEVRNPAATYFLPSQNEWYKAAYHKNDGVTGNYWEYPTSTDTEPYSDDPNDLNSPDNSNVANYRNDDGIANGYNDFLAVPGPNHLTEVGAYSEVINPFGTFDQGGNVREWTDTLDQFSLTQRVVLGGGWDEFSIPMAAFGWTVGSPDAENSGANGFRVASSIPEPSTALLGTFASLIMLRRRKRSRY